MKPPSQKAIDAAVSILIESINEENHTAFIVDYTDWDASPDLLQDKVLALKLAGEALVQRISNTIIPQYRGRINAFAPISQLPAETLGEILILVCRNASSRPEILSTLSLVSKLFRDVVLGSGRFWSRIDSSDNLKAVQTFLERSRSCDLDVVYRGPDAVFVATILPYSERWASLHVNPTTSSHKGAVKQLTESQTGRLEALSVYFIDRTGLRINLSEGKELRSLILMFCSVPWDHKRLSALTHLQLQRIEDPPTPAQLLRILTNSPQLEYLHLHGWAGKPRIQQQVPQSHDIVVLPSLITWDTSEIPTSHLNTLISYIRAPRCDSIRLDALGLSSISTSQEIENATKFLCPMVSRCTRITLNLRSEYWDITGYDQDPERPRTCPVVDMFMSWGAEGPWMIPKHLGEILAAIPLTTSMTLSIIIEEGFTENFTDGSMKRLRASLRYLPAIDQVEVEGVSPCLHVLQDLIEGHGCPGLKTLTVSPGRGYRPHRTHDKESRVADRVLNLIRLRGPPNSSSIKELLLRDFVWQAVERVVGQARALGVAVTCDAEPTSKE